MIKNHHTSVNDVRQSMIKACNHDVDFIVASPGRINLIGEHTDYNLGYSVPSAIDKFVYVGFAKLDGCDKAEGSEFRAELVSLDFGETKVVTEVKKDDGKKWFNYVLGVIDRIGQIQGGIRGRYRIVITGSLGIGLGISSSAALCCGVAYGLNKLLNANLSLEELTHVAQWSEHHYIGTKCGLLDQTAIIFSRESSFIKVDFLTGERTFYPVPFPMSVILLHSGEYHSLSETCYNQRVSECSEAAHHIMKVVNKTISEPVTLRECDLDDLSKAHATLDPVLYKRAKYVIEENLRVEHILTRIIDKDFDEIRKIMHATHRGLTELYEVSTERLDFLADTSNSFTNEAFGARLMGGGFGGCTINLVFPDKEELFIHKMSEAFKAKFNEDLKVIAVKLSKGVHHFDFK